MAIIKPFRALRPKPELAKSVAALPYDVMNRKEAAELAKDNPHSFLHITRSELGLPPTTGDYDDAVYEAAAANLKRFEADGTLIREEKPCFYIYAQTMDGRTQTGVVAGASIDEYLDGRIKKHEHTREAKEIDRIRHITATNAGTGPVFMAHKPSAKIRDFIRNFTAKEPLVDFVSDDGVGHTVWIVDDDKDISELAALFAELDALYIADGHHRNASAAKVALKKREEKPNYTGDEPFNYFLTVIFASDELVIMDYNRVVFSLNGHTEEDFLAKVKQSFDISDEISDKPVKPAKRHTFGMYLNKKWYKLSAKTELINKSDPVAGLDCSILQDMLLAPILGIDNPRTSPNIDFVGGLRGVDELSRRVDADGGKGVAFSLFPTSMEELISIADSGQVMPPKSTWFEPKLRSGLFVYTLD